MSDATLFCISMDDHKAAVTAMRDAERVRQLWALHGTARRLTDRRMLAEQAQYLERMIIRTADALIARAASRLRT